MTLLDSSISFTDRAKRYCRSIILGERIASRYTKAACLRFLDDLARDDWRWEYSEARAHKVCKFIELCPHEKGSKQSQPIRLEDWQVWIICNLFGFIDRITSYRRFREAVMLIPRKQGKSPVFGSALGLYMAFFDGELGAEVYCGALTEQQAFEVFRPAKAMLEGMPALCLKYGIEINAKSLVQASSRSRFLPVIGVGRDGSMPHCFIGDEAHQWKDSSLYDSQSTGIVGRKQPLKIIITTAGDTIEGPAYAKQKELEQLLDGVTENERLFGVIYTADLDVNWTSYDALLSANPNMGVSVMEEALVEGQQEAIRNASKQGNWRCKHLNHWISAASAWMNMQKFRDCADPTLQLDDFTDDPCILSSDLASKIDLCALCKLWRREIDGKTHYYAFVQCYVPEAQVEDPAHQHYQRWSADGYLTATEGSSIDYRTLEADTIADIERFKVGLIVYDERYADQFTQRISELTGIDRVVIPPSSRELSPAMKEVESAVYDGRFHYFSNPLLEWAMGNVLTKETVSGNLTMPDKTSPERKIDPAVALFLAMNRAMVAPTEATSWAFAPFTI
jgi:phage terminase large subunit-like protein